MADFGWAFIKGSSIQGTTNGLLVKTGDAQATGQSALTWDSTTQTMRIAAANSSTDALVITEGMTTMKTLTTTDTLTAQSKIVAKREIEAGTEQGRYALSVLGSHSPGDGVIMRVNSGEYFPPNYIGQVAGPYHITQDSQVTISSNAVVAVIDGATALPSVLRSYVSVASTAAS